MISKNKEASIYGVIDERTKAVVHQGDAYAARFMMFALLVDVIVRGLKLNNPITNSNWDLMLIVIVGGFISTIFQYKQKILFSRPFSRAFAVIISLMVLAAIISLLAIKFIFK